LIEGETVTLDGSGSTDPEDQLEFTWQGDGWKMEGPVVTAHLGEGTHEISLTVRDPSGHIDRDVVELTVVGQPPQPVARLVEAHPNPFNGAIRVSFESPDRQRVSLQIFDPQGRLVRTLEDGVLDPGLHVRSWNGTDDAGRAVSSGRYLVRMRAGDRVQLNKVSLLR